MQSYEVRPGSRYITLSHCWGESSGDKGLKLTQTTADTLSTKQPVHILPKTFRDAFSIIERLGINYLWIDRFCIFQDSSDDWRSESSAVCNIYTNGLLNVAALGAHNSDGGCFFSRDPAHVQATVVQLCIEGPDKPQPYRFELEKGWVWRLSFNRDPLQERGWTIQERLLAPRVLHFGSKQVFWECGEANCCELHPRSVNLFRQEDKGDELLPRLGASGPSAPWKHLLDSPHHFTLKDSVRQLFTDWYGILMQYAECKLSFPSDKLVAISGVAKDMKKRLAEFGQDTDYLAGLWRCELPQSLVWNLRGTGTRPPVYRAPSWSWAAVDGRVNMAQWLANPDDILLSSLIAAETTPLGEDETGQVLTGSVTLKGPLVTVKLSGILYPFLDSAFQIERLEKSESAETLMEPPKDGGCSVHFDTKDDICGQVLCLPIKARKWAEKWSVRGLALSPVDDGRYVRIGSFGLHVPLTLESKELFQGLAEKEIVII